MRVSIRHTSLRYVFAIAVSWLSLFATFAAEGVSFAHRPLLAGKASLVNPGFEVSRTLGIAALAPELQLPIELVYDSSSDSSGVFGFGWRSPQLESSARWSKDGLLWTTPWGEKIKFFPKKDKTPKDAIKLAPVENAKKGRGLFAPYSDWEADSNSSDYQKSRAFVILGKNELKGWRFAYENGWLIRIETPNDTIVTFERDASSRLLSVAAQGSRFIELEYAGELVSSLHVNGVSVSIGYSSVKHTLLPKTKDGIPVTKSFPTLSRLQIASLIPETFAYDKGYLSSLVRGGHTERIACDDLGRILSDDDFSYSYKHGVQLENKSGAIATYNYNKRDNIFTVTDFSGQSTTTYYFMRYDVAYLGSF